MNRIHKKLADDLESLRLLPAEPSFFNVNDYIRSIDLSPVYSADEKLCFAAGMLDAFNERALKDEAIKLGLKFYMAAIKAPEETRGAQLFFDALLNDRGMYTEKPEVEPCYNNHALVIQSMQRMIRKGVDGGVRMMFNAYIEADEPFVGPVKHPVIPPMKQSI